jgi:phage terminase large subunit GpA-like protein
VAGLSRIEKKFNECTQEHFCHPCPHCGEMVWLQWDFLDFSQEGTPQEPLYQCPHCGRPSGEVEIKGLHETAGEWRAQAESKIPHAVSMHIWEAYSPWVTWPELVANWLEAKRTGPEAIQAFKNTSLGETYEETAESVDPVELAGREKVEITIPDDGPPQCPEGVCFITAGLDFHDDSFECEIVGWGAKEKSWSLAYEIRHGQPDSAKIEKGVAEVLGKTWRHPSGRLLAVSVAGFDTGDGEWSQVIADLCRPKMGKRVGWLPIKGANNANADIWRAPAKPKRTERGKVMPYLLGVSKLKKIIWQRLKEKDPDKPGYMAFGAHCDAKYFKGLSEGEKLVPVKHRGFTRWEWHRRGYNEPLDCRAYNLGVLRINGVDLDSLAVRYRVKGPAEEKPAKAVKKTAPRRSARRSSASRGRGGWAKNW